VINAVAVPVIGGSASEGASLRRDPPYNIRQATAEDARAIHELITRYRDEGHLLSRRLEEIVVHASRFIVAVGEYEVVVGCVDLAPLSRTVAEIRSLVVDEDARSAGIGRQMIDAAITRAKTTGFERVCAFTHAPSYFVQLGFSIVPHDWLPDKISTNCGTCAQFRTCGQWAVMLPLRSAFAKASTSAKAPVDKTADKRALLHG
jgi:amino-acid N-acetyltransferase